MNTLAGLCLLLICVAAINGQACGPSGGCAGGLCCSRWGYCGNSNDHCGDGCQSGSCRNGGGGSPPSNSGGGTQRCGSDWNQASSNCGKGCSNNGDCPGGQFCFKDLAACGGGSPPPPPPPTWNPPPVSNNGGGSTQRCGANWGAANSGCGNSCTNNGDCGGGFCFKDLSPCSGGNPPPNQGPPSTPQQGGAGSPQALVNQATFDRAMTSCGVNKPNLYNDMIRGFTASLPGGLNELAILLGNLAHESGAFVYVEEIKCAGRTGPTGDCPYSPYHGRGYIQLSWDYNYREASQYLNNPAIFSNPNLVQNDQAVNWQTVQWFWQTRVQPTFSRRGVTMGASVRAINGGLECDWGAINGQRIRFIQCFQGAFGVPVDFNTACPAGATEDEESVFADSVQEDEMQQGGDPELQGQEQSLPTSFVIALTVLGSIILVLALIVVVILVAFGNRMRSHQRA